MFRKSKKSDQHQCEVCWTEGRAGNVVQYLEDKQCWVCAECLDIFDGASIDRMTEDTPAKEDASAKLLRLWEHPQNPKATAKFTPIVRECTHNRTPFSFNEHTLYLSGSMDRNTEAQGPEPTVAVYLDGGWLKGRVLSNNGMQKTEGDPHIVYLNWPDYGAVPVSQLMGVAQWALDRLDEGHTLEVGCAGGHGRTGTFVTGMMVLTGFHPKEAIKEIRANYCHKAVESKAQEELLGELYELMDAVTN